MTHITDTTSEVLPTPDGGALSLNRQHRRALGLSSRALATAIPIILRDYQTHAISELRAAYAAGYRGVLLVLPTGAGKTIVFSYIVALAVRLGRRVLIITHRRELSKQASDKTTLAGVEHGIIAPGFPETDHPVQIASIQTLARRLDRLQQYDLLIFDEAHHCVAGQYLKLIGMMPKAKILGVTATPQRLDGKGLGIEDGGVFDHIVVGATVPQLIEQGALCTSRVYAPAEGPDLRSIRTRMGDFATDGAERIMSVASIIGDAVGHYRKYANGKSAICFCVSIKHALKVTAAFVAAGYRAACVHGKMRVEERNAVLAGLAMGEVQVVTSCDLIGEGLDVPNVECVILLRPTKSVALHLQQIGRGLRPAPGKERLIVLDHAGNCLRSGFVEDPRAWSLKGREGRPPEGSPEPSRCPDCGALHRAARECPSCGHVYPTPDSNPREVEEIGGELREVTQADRLQRLRRWPLRTLLTGRETREQLEEIRRARGYKAGWVWHTLQSQRTAMLGDGVSQ